jgi:hypothetical protein
MHAHTTPDSGLQQRPLTDRQERFIHEYLIDHNASAAAARAGYSEKTKGSTAAELLKDERICERIAVEMADLFAKLKVNALDLMRRQLNLADLDPSKLFDDDEEAIPLKDLDEDTKRALTVNYDKRRGVTVMKVRQTPRHIALAALWRRFDVMVKMREGALAAERGRPDGVRGRTAGPAALPAQAVPRAPAFDILQTPVALNLQRIRDEARVRQEAQRREREAQAASGTRAAGEAQAASQMQAARAGEEAQARLREAEEELARARKELERVMAQAQVAECAGEAGTAEAAQGGEMAEADAGEAALCDVVEGEAGKPVPTRVFNDGLPLKGRRPAEGQARTGEVVAAAEAGATAEAVSDPATACVPEGDASRGGTPPAPAQSCADEAAYERERAAREQAREAQLERDMARLLKRDGRPQDAALVNGGPVVMRAAREVARKLAHAAHVRREVRQTQAAREQVNKTTPEPEMKPSLIEHLQRVRRQEQHDELHGKAGAAHRGKIAPGVVIGGGAGAGQRPPGYNPPWERNDRPRYADGREFEWSD